MPPERFADVPVPPPLPIAVAHGVFGWEVTGPMEPDAEQVRFLSKEHAAQMLAILEGIQWLEQCRDRSIDPQTGTPPRGKIGRQRAASVDADRTFLIGDYQDLMAVYADAFGDTAARNLDEYVRGKLTATRSEVQQVLFPP